MDSTGRTKQHVVQYFVTSCCMYRVRTVLCCLCCTLPPSSHPTVRNTLTHTHAQTQTNIAQTVQAAPYYLYRVHMNKCRFTNPFVFFDWKRANSQHSKKSSISFAARIRLSRFLPARTRPHRVTIQKENGFATQVKHLRCPMYQLAAFNFFRPGFGRVVYDGKDSGKRPLSRIRRGKEIFAHETAASGIAVPQRYFFKSTVR